ncbi:hypothetical protein GGQ92_000547 [Gracilibacillus halotolerans]|uniref:DUF2626 domain-containing protein n=1 Tax=Gracilibacillus halotolerans TaxID=74386 RepID=A0A841RCV3_9BACI|nr:DUF2626 family protein [Gracilibacillus halotolerans]MBB6511780.1 hypothetical protein [Gracilibacillus halotolerans]
MDRVFRGLGFWTGIFAVLFLVGDMTQMAFLFLAQTIFFFGVGFLKLSERMYIYLFATYCTVFFVGFTFYTNFIMVPGFGH